MEIKRLASRIMRGDRFACRYKGTPTTIAAVRDDAVILFVGRELISTTLEECEGLHLIATGTGRRVREVEALAANDERMSAIAEFMDKFSPLAGKHLNLSDDDRADLVERLQEVVLEYYYDDIQISRSEGERQ